MVKEKILRFFWGLLLLPLTLSTLYHLPILIFSFQSRLDSFLFLLSGAVFYVLFEILFQRPMRTYVFGHELTHALASLALGGKVHAFHISKKGGSVSLSRTNFFVALSPYGIPIYTLCIVLLYFLLRIWIPLEQLHEIFLILIGFSLAFHCSLTLFAICQEQPDIQKTGVLFSMNFILLLNSWFLILLSKILFWDLFSLKRIFAETMKTQYAIWRWVMSRLFHAYAKLVQ